MLKVILFDLLFLCLILFSVDNIYNVFWVNFMFSCWAGASLFLFVALDSNKFTTRKLPGTDLRQGQR